MRNCAGRMGGPQRVGALRALGAGGRGLAVDGASAVALATYATRTLALDLATFGDDDAERSVAAKVFMLLYPHLRSSGDKGRRLDLGHWTHNQQISGAPLVTEVCEAW